MSPRPNDLMGLSDAEYDRAVAIMGRAPMVKTSRMMPPTPVAAPW